MATAPAQAPAASAITATGSSQPRPSYRFALSSLSSLFFLWGFLTCLNDTLIPHLKAAFSLSYTEASLIQFAFFTAYFLVSLPAGTLVKRLGYQRGIVVGLVIAGLGCALLYPAAAIRSYPSFLGALFTLAAGITVLQVSANPYVAILGRPETASARLTLTQALNSLGTVLAPRFGKWFILSASVAGAAALSASEREAEVASVQTPYMAIAGLLLAIAVVMALLKLPTVVPAQALQDAGRTNTTSAWGYRHLVLGAVAIFVYVGGEVSIGSLLINFMGLKEIADMPATTASDYLQLYWGGAMVGRFAGSFLLSRVRPGLLLAINASVVTCLVVLGILLTGHAAMWSILAVGLFNSIMFPTIFSLAVDGLGPLTEEGSGILCMAIVGGALVPPLQGKFADTLGLHASFMIPAVCYLYIVYYGLKGYRHASAAPAAV